MPLDEPLVMAPVSGLHERETALLDRGERRHLQYLLLESANEAFDAANAFGRPHERRTRRDAEKAEFSYWLP
jgi:hypothetical protein